MSCRPEAGEPRRTRHLRLRARFIHEQLELGVLKVKHMPGENLVADLFTKPLAPARMQKLLALMNMRVFDERALRALLVMSLITLFPRNLLREFSCPRAAGFCMPSSLACYSDGF